MLLLTWPVSWVFSEEGLEASNHIGGCLHQSLIIRKRHLEFKVVVDAEESPTVLVVRSRNELSRSRLPSLNTTPSWQASW